MSAPAALPHTAMPQRAVLFFHYRSLMESDDIDQINFVGWKEVLDAFGYGELTYQKCVSDLALKSPHEVMTSLCPYTTRAEWAPLLNKRDTRLEKEISELCFAQVLPLRGIKDFIIDCVKHSNCTVVFLSPFRETAARQLLERAELGPFVDVVHSYTEREFGILEALEVLDVRPPHIPTALHHRWENEPPCTEEGELAPLILAFETDVQGVHFAKNFGVRSVVISYNPLGVETEAERSPHRHRGDERAAEEAAMPTSMEDGGNTKHDEAILLNSGASMVIKDFSLLKYEYLHHLR